MLTADDLNQAGYWADMEYDEDKDFYITDPLWYVKQFAKVTEQTPTPSLYATLIQEEFDEWRSSYLQDDKLNEIKELSDLLYVIYGYANALGVDISDALWRIHENNLGRVVQDDGTVKRREDGKIIKNPNAPKVDLRDLFK